MQRNDLIRCGESIFRVLETRENEDFPFSVEMISQKVAPNSAQIWNWGTSKMGANLIAVDYDSLMLTLLPRTTGRFSRRGLTVNKLRYRHDDYAEHFLKGGTATVAYNPDDASAVWLLEDGEYIRFDLVESRFAGKDLLEVQSMKSEQRTLERASADANIQAQIDLALHIEAIANGAGRYNDTNISGIRRTRKKEQNRAHVNFMEGGAGNEDC